MDPSIVPQGLMAPMMPLPFDVSGMPTTPLDAHHPGPVPMSTLASALASVTLENQRMMLGEQLFPLVERVEPDHAGKVTGMLLEMDQTEVLHLIEALDALKKKVSEALGVLYLTSSGPNEKANKEVEAVAKKKKRVKDREEGPALKRRKEVTAEETPEVGLEETRGMESEATSQEGQRGEEPMSAMGPKMQVESGSPIAKGEVGPLKVKLEEAKAQLESLRRETVGWRKAARSVYARGLKETQKAKKKQVLVMVQGYSVDRANAELLMTKLELEAKRRKVVSLEFQLGNEQKKLEEAHAACTVANEWWEEAMSSNEDLRAQSIKEKEELELKIAGLERTLADERAKLMEEKAGLEKLKEEKTKSASEMTAYPRLVRRSSKAVQGVC
ncbi:golgin subfamily A member 5-like [Camellia sinensis]|uniref:golgin subfamily A member 5-like n=1 Tax=Camellia sinensis TaxID=4442 RepID=UPI0010355FF6|nr:golgin subfamily A member 5-like [Camellia sinensis]